MTTEAAPLLTAAMSQELYLTGWADGCGDALQALAAGRTACVRVMSEDECRAEFRSYWAKHHPFDWYAKERDGEPLPHGDRLRVWAAAEQAYMACARAMGAVR